MPDTKRSLADLQTLLADNVGGAISPQDIRDFLISVYFFTFGSINSGVATITSGNTSVVVTHGLGVTPTIDDISVVAGEDPTNSVGLVWVDTFTSTQFTINCEADPGVSNLDFGWRAAVLQ